MLGYVLLSFGIPVILVVLAGVGAVTKSSHMRENLYTECVCPLQAFVSFLPVHCVDITSGEVLPGDEQPGRPNSLQNY